MNNVNLALSRTAAANLKTSSPPKSTTGDKRGVINNSEECDMDTSEGDSRTVSNGVSNGSTSSCMNGSSDRTQDYDMGK